MSWLRRIGPHRPPSSVPPPRMNPADLRPCGKCRFRIPIVLSNRLRPGSGSTRRSRGSKAGPLRQVQYPVLARRFSRFPRAVQVACQNPQCVGAVDGPLQKVVAVSMRRELACGFDAFLRRIGFDDTPYRLLRRGLERHSGAARREHVPYSGQRVVARPAPQVVREPLRGRKWRDRSRPVVLPCPFGQDAVAVRFPGLTHLRIVPDRPRWLFGCRFPRFHLPVPVGSASRCEIPAMSLRRFRLTPGVIPPPGLRSVVRPASSCPDQGRQSDVRSNRQLEAPAWQGCSLFAARPGAGLRTL